MIIRHLITGLIGIWILGTKAVVSFYSPQHVMVDVTNDFGVCVLQLISSKKENIAFSPYGLVSVALVLYEGSTGPSAAEIHNTLRLPWDREVTRVGFRDMHRYLKSYFSNDGFLRGLVLSKPNIMLRKNYTDLLQFYGFDVRTSPPRVPTTAVPPVLTTGIPSITTPKPSSTKPPGASDNEKTTMPTTVFNDIDGRFGPTTTETPSQQTTLKSQETTMVPQTSTAGYRTTKTTMSVVTSVPTTIKLPTADTLPPTTKVLPTTTTTTPPPTTKTTPPPTTTTQPPTTTTKTIPLSSSTQPPITTLPPTKRDDSPQTGTTLDVITMTDKKPDTPEIMSQVNMSATATPTTTGVPTMMEGREGDADMDLETTKLDTTTSNPTSQEMNPSKPSFTTPPPPETTTMKTTDTVEVSIAETTVIKTVTMVDPNTTPIPSTIPQVVTTLPIKPETESITLLIETTPLDTDEDHTSESVTQGTTILLPNDTTAPPEEILNLTATTVLPTVAYPLGVEGTPGVTIISGPVTPVVVPVPTLTPVAVEVPGAAAQVPIANIPALPGVPPTAGINVVNEAPTVVPPIIVPVETVPPNGAATETTLPPVALTETIPTNPTLPVEVTTRMQPPISVTTVEPPVPVAPVDQTSGAAIPIDTLANYAPLEPISLSDTETSESRNAENLARQQRSLFSTHKTPEYHKSGSNWVPQYQDHRWGQNPSNQFWFFTFTGGEDVPAHTYTAYLPFAFVPELSSLALQLPLDDPRYSILILLPEERLGLSQLLYSLQWCPVRAILTHLKMTAVYAVVPAFTIVKHINLVPALAKMGIHSVFDPFRADLSPMTSEPHLFVRTIEQVVTVSLRKYYASNRWFEASPNEVRQHFVANHPFAYFVLDKETDVTLMAGTIVNPVAHNQ